VHLGKDLWWDLMHRRGVKPTVEGGNVLALLNDVLPKPTVFRLNIDTLAGPEL